MAVRNLRGAGLRRLARGSAGFVALGIVLYLAAGVSATWPAVLHARTQFLSGGAPGHGDASPGDHLQTLYHWWLVGDQLDHGQAPWLDPYSFRPEASAQPNYPGWPFGFLFWPLGAAFGLVVAWNLMQLVIYVLAGLFACAWLRELGLPRGPALAGGLIFAIAPYRVEQSVGHLLGPISILLALALWAVERARRTSAWWLVLAGAAIASVPLSGQVHLALGAIPFFLAYALVRLLPTGRRSLVAGVTAGTVAAIGAGILVRQTVIVGSTQAGGRSLTEVSLYSARWSDFVTRHVDHARSEQFVYLGWATPLLALLGLALLLRSRRIGLAVVLGLGALLPILLALGTRLPLYSGLWHALPPFRFPRVPERLLPIACLCLAGLAAFAISRARVTPRLLAAVAIVLVFLDLHARVYGKSTPDMRPTAGVAAAGRVLELPVFDPGIHYGSVYLWDDTAQRRQRPAGYSTSAPVAAKATATRLERLNCGDWSSDTAGALARLGVTTVALHLGLYVHNSAVPNVSYFAWRALVDHGWSLRSVDRSIWMFTRGLRASHRQLSAPLTRKPVFCQGWYGDTGSGHPMSESHAPFWLYGGGMVTLHFAPSPLARTFTVDGKPQLGPTLVLGDRGWHVVTVDVPRLVRVGKQRIGLQLVSLSTSPSRGSRSRHRGSSR